MENLKMNTASFAAFALIVFVFVLIFAAASDSAAKFNTLGCKRVAGVEGWVCPNVTK